MLEAVYLRLDRLLLGCRQGKGTAAQLVEVYVFLAGQLRPMLEGRREMLVKLSKMLSRHERKRNGGTAAPVRKESARGAAAKAVAFEFGVKDASVESDASQYTLEMATNLLKGRIAKVSASDYVESESGEDLDLQLQYDVHEGYEAAGNEAEDADEAEPVLLGTITSIDEAEGGDIQSTVTFPATAAFVEWSDSFTLPETLERIVPFADLSRDQLLTMLKKHLQREVAQRQIPGRSKMTVPQLADALIKEYERLRDAVPGDGDEQAAAAAAAPAAAPAVAAPAAAAPTAAALATDAPADEVPYTVEQTHTTTMLLCYYTLLACSQSYFILPGERGAGGGGAGAGAA